MNPRETALKRKIAILLVLFTTLGCGYRLAHETPNPAPVDLNGKKVSIHILKNHTGEPDIEYIIPRAIASEFIRTPQVRVVKNDRDADYVLKGKVTSYSKHILSLDYQGTGQYYQLTVTIHVILENPATGKTIDLGEMSEDSEYHIARDLETSKTNERRALDRISQELAQRLTALLL